MRARMTTLALVFAFTCVAYGAAQADPPPPFMLSWGTLGTGPGEFNNPYGVALDPAGDVYVTDQNNNRVQKFNPNGTFVMQFPTPAGSLPGGIEIGRLDNIYVVMSALDKVIIYTPSGAVFGQFGKSGSLAAQFINPGGIGIDSGFRLYIADTGNDRVQKFSIGGSFQTLWGSTGSGPGQFIEPRGVAVDASNNIYVVDRGNSRVQKFTNTGVYLAEWGTPGTGDGQFVAPEGVDIDFAGNVYVTDGGNNDKVQKFTNTGVFLSSWGGTGSADGQFVGPGDCAADGLGEIFVADQGNNRIQVFGGPPVPGLKKSWGNLKALYR